jgi:hypothetical protein
MRKWTAASNTWTIFLSSGLTTPWGVRVDGSGNVYIADEGATAIEKWTAANQTLTTLVPYTSGLSDPLDAAVDKTGNIYVVGGGTLQELPYAFVDTTPKTETAAAGTDALPVVLPATENLLTPFAPTSSAPSWLAISGVANGVVSFSFTANTSTSSRTANITLLGKTIPVTQGVIGTPPILSGLQLLDNGLLQFAFTNNPTATFTVLSATNLSLPLSNWTAVGAASNMGGGQFQVTLQPVTNTAQSFYTVRSP